MDFSSVKIPLRLILDNAFKACYKRGYKEKNIKVGEKYLRCSLYLLTCMLINNIFVEEF